MANSGAPDGNKNAEKHGAYSFRDNGKSALEENKRSRLAELSEIVQIRPGVVGLLQERCVRAIMMCEILESYIVTQKQSGSPLEDIKVLKQLPAFQNSAQRCIQTLLHEMHEDPNALDEGKVLEAVKREKKED